MMPSRGASCSHSDADSQTGHGDHERGERGGHDRPATLSPAAPARPVPGASTVAPTRTARARRVLIGRSVRRGRGDRWQLRKRPRPAAPGRSVAAEHHRRSGCSPANPVIPASAADTQPGGHVRGPPAVPVARTGPGPRHAEQRLAAELPAAFMMLHRRRGIGRGRPPTAGAVRHIAFQTSDVDGQLRKMGDEARVTLGPIGFDRVHPRLAVSLAARP